MIKFAVASQIYPGHRDILDMVTTAEANMLCAMLCVCAQIQHSNAVAADNRRLQAELIAVQVHSTLRLDC